MFWKPYKLKADGKEHTKRFHAYGNHLFVKVFEGKRQASYTLGSDGCSVVAKTSNASVLIETCDTHHKNQFTVVWRADRKAMVTLIYKS